MNLIEIKDLSFTYPGQTQPTLRVKDFTVKKGEQVFLFGPSGTGKTTLLEILAGVLVPQAGSVAILNQDLGQMSASGRDAFRAEHLGYVFQSFNLIPYLSVEQNIELPYYLSAGRKARLSGKPVAEEVRDLLSRLGMSDFLKRRVTELSIGQQQRVAVARALLGHPELILADEPTSSLDYDHREMFIRLLFEIAREQKTTVIFVSHDRTLEKLFSRSVSLLDLQGSHRKPEVQ